MACGGGSDDDSRDSVLPTITSVSGQDGAMSFNPSTQTYSTQSDEASISGDISTGAVTISWANSGGGSGSTAPGPVYCINGIFGFDYQCGWQWGIGGIPLSLGANTITIATAGDLYKPAQVSITIIRQPRPPSPPRLCVGPFCIGG